MATTYTWKIDSLDCTANIDIDTDCDIITSAIWTLTGNNGTISTSITSKTPLNINMEPNGEQSNNEPYLTLLEADVISEIQHALGTNQIAQIEAQIDSTLNTMTVNTITPALPWAV